MVFLVGQESEEFPGKITNEVINISGCDGFKIVNIDGVYNVYSVGGNGTERYMFTDTDHQECIDTISSIMRLHVTNEPHTIITMEEFVNDVDEIQDKNMLMEIMLDLMRRHGYDDIVDQYINMLDDDQSEYDETDTEIEEEFTSPHDGGDDQFAIEDQKFR